MAILTQFRIAAERPFLTECRRDEQGVRMVVLMVLFPGKAYAEIKDGEVVVEADGKILLKSLEKR